MWCSDNPWWWYVISNLISISFHSHLFIESTTIALLARLSGVLEPLREFVKQKPVWGTCAGAILLSQAVKGAKKGGQDLLGGMSITIARNGWGSQVRAYIWCILPCLNVKLDRIFWSWLMCARTPESWAAVYRIIHPSSGRWLHMFQSNVNHIFYFPGGSWIEPIPFGPSNWSHRTAVSQPPTSIISRAFRWTQNICCTASRTTLFDHFPPRAHQRWSISRVFHQGVRYRLTMIKSHIVVCQGASSTLIDIICH